MYRISLLLLLFLVSCNSIRKITWKAEEEHNALYRQKVLLVTEVKDKMVYFSNPTSSRCYYLKGKTYAGRWHTGDTMIIDSNLTDFYNLRYLENCR